MTIKTLIFVRHGEADHNVGYKEIGQEAYFMEKYIFSGLTLTGKKQAELLGKKFAETQLYDSVDVILTSPLDRTLETTQYMTQYCKKNIPIIAFEDIREFGYIHPCNMRRNKTELEKMYTNIDFSNLNTNDDLIFKNGDQYDRINNFIHTIKHRNDEKIMIISHASYLLELFDELFCRNMIKDNDILNIDNCEFIIKELNL